MAQAWYNYSINNPYSGNPNGGEMGVDLTTPFHTPITALFPGTVNWAGRTQWACGSSGGMVSIVCTVPQAPALAGGSHVYTSYYLHLDQVDVKVGDVVKAGQQVGLSGGQLSGGTMPVVNCKKPVIVYSTGAHTEFGFNAPWVSGPGKNINPTFAIQAARAGTLQLVDNGTTTTITSTSGTPGQVGTGAAAAVQANAGPIGSSQLPVDAAIENLATLSATTHKVINQYEGFESICEGLQEANTTPEWNYLNPFGSFFSLIKPWFIRLIFVAIAMIIIYFALHEYIQDVQRKVQQTVQIAMPAGGAGGAAGGADTGAALAAAPEAAAL